MAVLVNAFANYDAVCQLGQMLLEVLLKAKSPKAQELSCLFLFHNLLDRPIAHFVSLRFSHVLENKSYYFHWHAPRPYSDTLSIILLYPCLRCSSFI